MRRRSGVGVTGPAASISPRPNDDASAIIGAGTCENTVSSWRRSSVEFTRISSRLSHCETTFGCTFCGRCVASNRWMPNLRPSPAIHTASSVTARPSSVAAAGGQMLCASSITIRTDRRCSRRRIRPSRPSDTTSRSWACSSDPVSRTITRHPASMSTSDRSPSGAHTPHPPTPRLTMRWARRRLASSSRDRSTASTAAMPYLTSPSEWMASMNALNSSLSAMGSSPSVSACSPMVRSLRWICSGMSAPAPRRATTTRPASAWRRRRAASSRFDSGRSRPRFRSAVERSLPRCTWSEFGSMITIGSVVSSSNCSNSTPIE